MGFLDKIKELFGKPKEGLPDNFGAPTDFKQRAEDSLDAGKQKANEIADKVQESIPGQTDDKVIDSLQDRFNGTTDTTPPAVTPPTPTPAPEVPPATPPSPPVVPPQPPQTPQV